jgi:hypothetical protein
LRYKYGNGTPSSPHIPRCGSASAIYAY